MKQKNQQQGFIQIPILIAILVGTLVVGGTSYIGIRQYQHNQVEKAEQYRVEQEKEKQTQELLARQQKAIEDSSKAIENLKIDNTNAINKLKEDTAKKISDAQKKAEEETLKQQEAIEEASQSIRYTLDQSGVLSPSAENLEPITNADHIRGNLSAQIKIVEFSDTECPFCKQFHPVVKQVFDEYSADNKVAWIYRHFPIAQLHPKAHYEAEATECAGSVGGSDKFWTYLDRIFTITPSNDDLDPAELPKIAAHIGLDVGKFNSCLASGKFKTLVDENIKDAENSGVTGTPSSFLIDKYDTVYPLQGAVSYEQLKQAIETLLAK